MLKAPDYLWRKDESHLIKQETRGGLISEALFSESVTRFLLTFDKLSGTDDASRF
jgi:hypothetical protein